MLSTVAVSRRTGVPYKVLDAWARAGILHTEGAGQNRRWKYEVVPRVRAVAALAELGARRDVLVRVGRYVNGLALPLWDGPLYLRKDGMVLPTHEGASYLLDLREFVDETIPMSLAV